MIRGLAIGALLALSGCSPSPVAGSHAQVAQTVPLTITSGKRVHRFDVEVARTEAQQERGLMFRERLSPDGGMLFPMEPPRVASFWMRNTLIPLDMIFIRADGTIARIAENTVPYSLTPVTSDEPVAAVFEIAGGRAAQLGISADDRVSWPR